MSHLKPTWDMLLFLLAFHMIFAPILEIILLNLFNSNCELKRLGTWVLQPWIVHGQQWADWMAIGNLQSNRGTSELEHLSYGRRADASPQWMEMKISYQTNLFWYRTVCFIPKCCAS